MYISVFLFPLKPGMAFKGECTGMLQDKDTFRFQDPSRDSSRRKDLVRNRIKPVDIVRWVRENDIETETADIEKIEDIVPDHMHTPYAESRGTALYE